MLSCHQRPGSALSSTSSCRPRGTGSRDHLPNHPYCRVCCQRERERSTKKWLLTTPCLAKTRTALQKINDNYMYKENIWSTEWAAISQRWPLSNRNRTKNNMNTRKVKRHRNSDTKTGKISLIKNFEWHLFLKEYLKVYVAKTKALISCTVTAQLICTFVFAYMQKAGFLMMRLI